MRRRSFFFAALAPMLALAACDGNGTGLGSGIAGGGGGTAATVQFINATGTAIDVATNGTVGAGNANVSFGGASSCVSVNPASPGLTVRQAGTTSTIGSFTPTLQAGNSYTVVAYLDAAGATQFATLPGTFTPASGQSGLRVFNASANTGSFDAYVTTPGAALGTPLATGLDVGSASNFFNVPNGTGQLRFANAGTSTVSLDAGTSTFVSGQSATAVLAPPAFSGTGLRSFIVPGCP